MKPSGTGSNDGYPKDDHVLVTDPFEKHVTRTMDALKKSLERNGCTMDSIIHAEVFICLPHADTIPMPTGKARFDAHKAQYDALNKIYGTYFSPGKAPSRACMAVELEDFSAAIGTPRRGLEPSGRQTTTRRTSSIEVTPLSTLSQPSIRRVAMPSARAVSPMTAADTRSTVCRSMVSDTFITSCSATRPL